MLQRAITGGIFVATLLFFTTYSAETAVLLFAFFVVVGSWEYLNILTKHSEVKPNFILGLVGSFVTYLTIIAPITGWFSFSVGFAIALPIYFSVFLSELYRKHENPFSNVAHTLMPSIYIALPFGLLLLANNIVGRETGEFFPYLIVGFYFMLWSNDTGAYLAGKAFGKHKLFERISPNKTWEGSIGGATLAVIVSIVCAKSFGVLPLYAWITMGLIIAVIGSMGDLVESLFKRSMGVKDSGNIMPGHGGILDRFDGLLLAAPFVFAFVVLIYL